jgi:hypothetical protein
MVVMSPGFGVGFDRGISGCDRCTFTPGGGQNSHQQRRAATNEKKKKQKVLCPA